MVVCGINIGSREESSGALDEKWKHMHWQWQQV